MNNEFEMTVTTEEKIDLYSNMKAEFEALKKAFEAQNAELIEAMNSLKAEIEADVLEAGATVRGENMMAVWNSGRTTWDGKLLKGFEVIFPEIGAAKKIGEPTVSFRNIVVE